MTEIDFREKIVLGQIALVVDRAGVDETAEWYQSVFGLMAGGGSDDAGGAHADALQRLGEPDPALAVRWLLDRNDLFQFEIFSYERPPSRSQPPDWTARDIGYSTVTIWVADFDETVRRLGEFSAIIRAASGDKGRRRAMTTDPNGVLIEVIEHDIAVPGGFAPAHPQIGATVKSIRLSVSDLDASATIFRECYGLAEVAATAVHGARDEHLWGLSGAAPEHRTFSVGNAFLEIVQYADPPGKPRPDEYRLSDAGIMNIALVTRSRAQYENLKRHALDRAFDVREYLPGDHSACAYIWDDQGFCTELLFVDAAVEAQRALGFIPQSGTGVTL